MLRLFVFALWNANACDGKLPLRSWFTILIDRYFFTQFIEIGWKAKLSIGTGYFRFSSSLQSKHLCILWCLKRKDVLWFSSWSIWSKARVLLEIESIRIEHHSMRQLIVFNYLLKVNKFRSENWKNLLKRNLNLSVNKLKRSSEKKQQNP